MNFDWFFKIVASIIVLIHSGLSHIFPADSGWAWGLSIFLLTVAMRIVIFPLFVKQIKSAQKMQTLQPQVQALRKKYKNDKQRLNQEMMKLYQEAGANPLGGCLPLLVQMPIFFGLFRVLNAISTTPAGHSKYGMSAQLIESAQHAKIIAATIPSKFIDAFQNHNMSAMIVTGCAVVISSTTTFFTMRASVSRSMQSGQMSDNPMMQSQRFLVYLSPLFGLFGLTLPLGVLIYWVTTNAWTLVQSHYIYKKHPMPKVESATAGGAGAARSTATGTKTGTRTAGKTGTTKTKAPAKQATAAGRTKKKVNSEEVEQDTPPKVVRQQPSRQTRSKRKR